MKMNGINGAGGTNVLSGINGMQGTDAGIKSLQKQIASAQKALQELSANKELSVEEKMQKRQELQQQINDLNNQLRQRQIDLRREKQKVQKADRDRETGKQQKQKDMPGHGMSKSGMEALVSADTAMKQAKVYGAVSIQLKGEERVLAGEIKQDKKLGLDVEQKEKKLAKIEERMQSATASQINTLEDANKELQEAREKEQETKLKDGEKKETEKAESKDHSRKIEKAEDRKRGEDILTKEEGEKQPNGTGRNGRYVDICL